MSGGAPEGVEKREPSEMDMRDHHHHHHHPLHQEGPPREAGQDLPTWLEHMRDAKDTKDQKPHEVREMRNVRTGNLRDIREVREMWEMRDPAQTVREYIDTSGNYPKNAPYSRTHPHWTPAYHVQPKN